jgi:hypothetical protein
MAALQVVPARAQIPLGTEFQVNAYVPERQTKPRAAMNGTGAFVVVWQSLLQDGSDYGIFGQRFDANGLRQGAEFRVNSYTTDRQTHPSVAIDGSGNFVVIWHSFRQDSTLNDTGVFGQRYDSAGVAQGLEFRVNVATFGDQAYAHVAMSPAGDFIVVWENEIFQIAGRRYSADGTPLAAEFQVNTNTTGFRSFPRVAVAPSGAFVVVWESRGQDGSGLGVFGQRFGFTGGAEGGEFRVNSYTTGYQWRGAVAMNQSDFVVVWQSHLQDGSATGLFGQRYAASGTPRGAEFAVNSYTTSYQEIREGLSAVALDGDGSFTVAWDGTGASYGQNNVWAQRFDAAGRRRGASFRVNAYITAGNTDASVSSDGKSRFVVAWHSSYNNDTQREILGRRFRADFIFGDGFDPPSP